MCYVRISEQTAIISLYSTYWLVFITETESVYCAVRSGSLYIVQFSLSLSHIYAVIWLQNVSLENNLQKRNYQYVTEHFKEWQLAGRVIKNWRDLKEKVMSRINLTKRLINNRIPQHGYENIHLLWKQEKFFGANQHKPIEMKWFYADSFF